MASNKADVAHHDVPNISGAGETYTDFKTAADLVYEAQEYLTLLKTVDDQYEDLLRDDVIRNALRRYETIWLPILAKYRTERLYPPLIPPLDVHWVWCLHMLNPTNYAFDCTAIVGFVPNHRFDQRPEFWSKYIDRNKVKRYWARVTDEPFEMDCSLIRGASGASEFFSKLSLDIINMCRNHRSFYYQVSLPHYSLTEFLRKAVVRYQRFITLKKYAPRAQLVPTFDIELIWHAHMLCAGDYAHDTYQYLGHRLDHEHTAADLAYNSKTAAAFQTTMRLWTQAYPYDDFLQSGTLYRGEDPKGTLHVITPSEEDMLFRKILLVHVVSVTLSGDLKGKYKLAGAISACPMSSLEKTTCRLTPKKGLPFVWQGEPELLKFEWEPPQDFLLNMTLERHGPFGATGFSRMHFTVSIRHTPGTDNKGPHIN